MADTHVDSKRPRGFDQGSPTLWAGSGAQEASRQVHPVGHVEGPRLCDDVEMVDAGGSDGGQQARGDDVSNHKEGGALHSEAFRACGEEG